MNSETITQSKKINGVYCIERPTYADERGFFREYFRLNEVEEAVGRPIRLVQANHSHSLQRVLRGVHMATFDKLIYAVTGRVQIALVDLRQDSSTFQNVEFFEIGESSKKTVFIPPGVGNSYYVLSERADYLYLVGEYYDPAKEKTLKWNDPDLGIPWTDPQPILSERDSASAQTFSQLFPKQ